jgi:integrase
MARGKGEGALFRVPKDPKKPLRYWRATVEVPDGTGKRARLYIQRKDKSEVQRLLREAQGELERTGHLETKVPTVDEWMTTWYNSILTKKAAPKTSGNWRGLIANHIVPAIGTKKLNKLTPADVRAVHDRMTKQLGLSSTSALQVHRLLALALRDALREGVVSRNVATLVDAPRKAAKNTRALSLDDGIKVLDYVKDKPGGSLWAAFLLTGAREGEILGLQPDRIKEHRRGENRFLAMEFEWQLQRYTWEHGCGGMTGETDPKGKPIWKCGWKRGADCHRRKVTLPEGYEGFNLVGGLWMAHPKTRSGWRTVPLVEPLQSIIFRHVEETADDPNPHGLVWRKPNGTPIDPRECNRMWHDLLDRVGVPQVRLHDARHTTVMLLLLAGVDIDVIRDIVGHASSLTTEEYKIKALTARHFGAVTSLTEMIDARREEQRRELGA